MRPFFVSPPISVPSSFRLTALVQITTSIIPSNVLSHYPSSLPHHFVTQPHLILCQHHPLYHSISSLHLVPIKRFRWNQMYSQTYLVPSKTFSRNEIENTRFHQQAICRPEKDLHPIEYVRAGRTPKKAPKKNLRGFVIPIGFKPITF